MTILQAKNGKNLSRECSENGLSEDAPEIIEVVYDLHEANADPMDAMSDIMDEPITPIETSNYNFDQSCFQQNNQNGDATNESKLVWNSGNSSSPPPLSYFHD